MKINLPKNIIKCINILNDNHFECFVIGGAIRDTLLKKKVFDYDLTTNALTKNIKTIFQNYKIIDTGIKHGTLTLIIDNQPLEITTYRIDGPYIKNRKPDKVIFTSSLKEDARRRDFTINAIAYHPQLGFIDYFEGLKDIQQKIIRSIDNPAIRFQEDALRILRAIRFKAQLNFVIEQDTLKAMFEKKELLKNISVERCMSEIDKILNYDNSENIINEFKEIFKVIIPDINLKNIIGNKNLKLAMILLNCSDDFINSLHLSNHVKKHISFIKKYHATIINNKIQIKLILNQNESFLEDILYLNKILYKNDKYHLYKEITDKKEVYNLKNLAVNGHDLLKLNIKKENIKPLLTKALKYVMENPEENNKSALLKFLKIDKQLI